MKPVDQLVIDDGKGDCLRACVASVLEMDPAGIPNFAEIGFLNGLREWLESRGGKLVWLGMPSEEDLVAAMYFGCAPEFFVAWGRSPRPRADGGIKQHAVVVKSNGYGIVVAHDPHPSRAGLAGPYEGLAFIL